MARKPTIKSEWEEKFLTKIKQHHKKNLPKVVSRLLRKITSAKSSMVTRSAKYGVECSITIDELRQMTFDAYGTPCKYSGRIMKIDNLVYDHIIPVAKGGPSTIYNIQIISRFSNNMKGSLSESHFLLLLEWLETAPEELRKDVSIRLAHGIH